MIETEVKNISSGEEKNSEEEEENGFNIEDKTDTYSIMASSPLSKFVELSYSFKTVPPEFIIYNDGTFSGRLARQYISFYNGLYISLFRGYIFTI